MSAAGYSVERSLTAEIVGLVDSLAPAKLALRGVPAAPLCRRPVCLSIRRKNEPVSFAVLEHRVGAPWLLLWGPFEFYAALFQFLIRLIDVVARVRHVHERADPFFISLWRKQHKARFRFRNSQLDPALLIIERLIGDNREPELVRVKIERAVLVGYGNADEFDLLDHDALNLM